MKEESPFDKNSGAAPPPEGNRDTWMIRYEAERKHQRGNLYEGEKDIKVLGKGTASLRYFRSNCLEFSLMKTDLVRKKRKKKTEIKAFSFSPHSS